MATDNRYTPPTAKVADIHDGDDVQPVRLFSPQGRIGRVRYLAYTTGATMIVGFIASALIAVAGPTVGGLLALLAYIAVIVFSILIMIQRSHDMNWSGWMIFLAIIPLVGLIWLFKAGTDGSNDYGAPPPPNTRGVIILAWFFPVLVILGILAAIAIPQYANYVQRSQQQEQAQ